MVVVIFENVFVIPYFIKHILNIFFFLPEIIILKITTDAIIQYNNNPLEFNR